MKHYLSASRIKKLEECTWTYYCRYVLKLPDESNDGAKMGSICHNVFEYLGKDRHRHHYDKIIEHDTIEGSEVVHRYILKCAVAEGVDSDEHLALMDKMILEGLKYDFFGEVLGKPIEAHSEIDFKLSVEDGDKKYQILGFIDKLFLHENGVAIIRDFKSSKRMFEGKDVTDNVQDLMYRLAIKILYPEYYDHKMEFVFLQFPCEDETSDGIIKTPHVSEEELEGFEYWLTEIQAKIDNFDETNGMEKMAYHKGYPAKEEGFAGRIVCGRADTPTEKKIDGNPKWFCRSKFAYFYWALKNKKGEVLQTSKLKKDLPKPKKGEKVEKMFYSGCPAFKFLQYNQELNTKAKSEGFETTIWKRPEKSVDDWTDMF